MPQKRNPVPLEHVRILASRSLHQATGVLGCVHNTPFADMNDAENTLQPLVHAAFDDGIRGLSLLTGMLGEAEFNTARMAAAADANFLPVTELADTLVRETGISFCTAHHIMSSAVRELTADGTGYDPDAMTALIERDLTLNHRTIRRRNARQIRASLSARNFVGVRNLPGGPAPIALEPEILRAWQQVHTDQQRLSAAGTHLREAHANLHQQTGALIGAVGAEGLHSTAADSTHPIPRRARRAHAPDSWRVSAAGVRRGFATGIALSVNIS